MVRDIVICSPARTPIGSFGGSLKDTPAAALGSHAIVAAIARAGLSPSLVDSVVMATSCKPGAA